MKYLRPVIAGICFVVLAGILIVVLPGGLLSVAQSGQADATGGCCDKTFAIASHPSIVTAGGGFPISQSGGQGAATSIWEDTDGRRALVTIECTAGDLRVAWDQVRQFARSPNPSPAKLSAGQAISVFAKNVWVYSATGATASGFYYVAVDVSE